MTPNRPYLLRAYYDWLMDNELTPHVVVDAFVEGTQVPQQYVKDGQIILNITASAVGNLRIGLESVEFSARFGGVPQQVVLPMASILAIYSKENGAGTVFEMEESYEHQKQAKDNNLSIVSERDNTATTEQSEQQKTTSSASDELAKRRSHLTLIK